MAYFRIFLATMAIAIFSLLPSYPASAKKKPPVTEANARLCAQYFAFYSDNSGPANAAMRKYYQKISGKDDAGVAAAIDSFYPSIASLIVNGNWKLEAAETSLKDCQNYFKLDRPVSAAPRPPMPAGAKLPAHATYDQQNEAVRSVRLCAATYYRYGFGDSPEYDALVDLWRIMVPTVSKGLVTVLTKLDSHKVVAEESDYLHRNEGSVTAITYNTNVRDALGELAILDKCHDQFGIMTPQIGNSRRTVRDYIYKEKTILAGENWNGMWRAIYVANRLNILRDDAVTRANSKDISQGDQLTKKIRSREWCIDIVRAYRRSREGGKALDEALKRFHQQPPADQASLEAQSSKTGLISRMATINDQTENLTKQSAECDAALF